MIKVFKNITEYLATRDTLPVGTKIMMNGNSGYDDVNTYQEIYKVITDPFFNGKPLDNMMENSMGWRRRG